MTSPGGRRPPPGGRQLSDAGIVDRCTTAAPVASAATSQDPVPSRTPAAPRPLVSCIIIFLNEERFLEEAIRSVFAQTYPHWELMLVDDGSTDGSSAVARRYATEHPDRVRYLEHPGHENRGMSASRNLGFSETRGEYVALLDGDDVWLPHKLIDQVSILSEHPEAAITYGRTRFWHGWTGDRVHRRREWLTPLGVPPNQIVAPPVLLTNFLNDETTGLSNCSVLVRRSVIAEVGGWENEFRTLYEDMVLWTKILSRWPAFVSERNWDLYRQHAGNSAVSATLEGIWTLTGPNAARKRFLDWMYAYLQTQGVTDRQLLETLASQLAAHRAPPGFAPWRRVGPLLERLGIATHELVETVRASELVQRIRLSAPVERWLGSVPEYQPPVGYVQFGELRQPTPLVPSSGVQDEGTIEQYYVDSYIRDHAGDLHGVLLEVGHRANAGTVAAGARVTHDERRTVHGDIAPDAGAVDIGTAPPEPESVDCVVCSDASALVPNPTLAVQRLWNALKAGGVLLMALPGVASRPRGSADPAAPLRFTEHSARSLLATCVPADGLAVSSMGNVYAAVAALEGVSAHELDERRLSHRDARYPMVIGVRATKPRRDVS